MLLKGCSLSGLVSGICLAHILFMGGIILLQLVCYDYHDKNKLTRPNLSQFNSPFAGFFFMKDHIIYIDSLIQKINDPDLRDKLNKAFFDLFIDYKREEIKELIDRMVKSG